MPDVELKTGGKNMQTVEEAIKDYKNFLKKIEDRPGIKELAAYLEKHNFLKAPASTKYHLCSEGGLILHSISVCRLALKLKKEMLKEVSDESIILCTLFHDAHKVTDGFSHSTYLKSASYTTNKPISNYNKPYDWNKEQMNFSGAQKSLLIISKFVDLTQDEMQAIAYHDGPYTPSWEDIKYDPYPLTLLIHFSDMWSSWVIEKGKETISYDKKFLNDL